MKQNPNLEAAIKSFRQYYQTLLPAFHAHEDALFSYLYCMHYNKFRLDVYGLENTFKNCISDLKSNPKPRKELLYDALILAEKHLLTTLIDHIALTICHTQKGYREADARYVLQNTMNV